MGGLDALLGLGGGDDDRAPDRAAAASVDAGSLVVIPVALVAPNPYQPRVEFSDDELEALARSIHELGVLQPILVRRIDEHRYELIAGERRWRAAQRAGLREIPAVVRDVDDQTSLEQAIVENLHRSDLNAIEEAAAYRQLMDDFGLRQEDVARRVGRSRSAVANTLRLLALPASVQRLILVGSLSAGHARALLAISDPTLQVELAARVVADELSVREVEDLVRSSSSRAGVARASSRAGARSAASLEVEETLASVLDTSVTVSSGRQRGRIVIDFADPDDLERIFRLIADRG
ncbi:MAG: ParB/RepB/Spo0J family partition protein [Actinomycetota bacterium]